MLYHRWLKLRVILLTIGITIIVVFGCLMLKSKCWGMGKKPLLEAKAQIAENMKLTDTLNSKITGLDISVKKMDNKIDNMASAQVGLNNTVSKVSSEVKAGRDVINDSQLMKDYIAAIKDGAQQSIMLYRFIIGGLIVQLGTCIGILGWCIKFLLKADERRDIREEKWEQKVSRESI